ncbi:hypothetical protein QBC36DRAFT_286624 [Triangularia setosa]|uniref:Uncharacterized protein n=1 Tax=Triangularia setosa TaxID=2587417 RepID=A0AAN7A9P5_9PEZI|nr:hypothetical protein QBC36DRAFT_286624 [Podospora setosa]
MSFPCDMSKPMGMPSCPPESLPLTPGNTMFPPPLMPGDTMFRPAPIIDPFEDHQRDEMERRKEIDKRFEELFPSDPPCLSDGATSFSNNHITFNGPSSPRSRHASSSKSSRIANNLKRLSPAPSGKSISSTAYTKGSHRKKVKDGTKKVAESVKSQSKSALGKLKKFWSRLKKKVGHTKKKLRKKTKSL